MKPPHDTNGTSTFVFPTTFPIGTKRTSPLVNTAQLRGHLFLMRAFMELKEQVRTIHEHPKAVLYQIPKHEIYRWAWFVGLAVERFTLWCLSINHDNTHGKSIIDILPPIDVIMVWHAYMLNPARWYAEDRLRLPSLATLHEVGNMFADSLPNLTTILALKASDARVEAWTQNTKRLFDPLDDAVEQKTKTLYCPNCRNPIAASLVSEYGRGYLQQGFGIYCPQKSCPRQCIIYGLLGLRKLAEDLVRNDGTMRSYLAGSLRTSKSECDVDRAKKIKDVIITSAGFTRPPNTTDEQWILFIMDKCSYFVKNIMGYLPERDQALFLRILNAYSDDRMFSVELTGAVLRQGTFIEKMQKLGWVGLSNNQEKETALQHAVARYHAYLSFSCSPRFLDLMASSPTKFFVPTLDIDLVWHTHQLMACKYNDNCRLYVGRFIDHDDRVDSDRLASSFDDTCRAWKNRFGIQYAYCGCLMPGETLKDKLLHFLRFHTDPLAHLVPIERKDILDTTHASDHNAVYPNISKVTGDASRKYEKRLKRAQQLSRKGKTNTIIPVKREGHNQAFLVPLWTYYQEEPVAGGCVSQGLSGTMAPSRPVASGDGSGNAGNGEL
ncbi:hypothetical protein BDZ94DRAFT_1160104 [Collybia nuda]|uniref:Uncharacterized protein n=1 Tax=Collybia nuda TaxID=64659 RepID=A0A9P5YAY5_9AGAR|nr:hypothetical protein BDZ94DRAFT_1160104 [Collybia nuda]